MPLEEFIAARDAIVKERRAAKDKAGAAALKALRKPTAAAWAVNQLSRKDQQALADLLALGERLRRAQDAALSGRGAAALRDLSVQRRTAVEALTRRALDHLGGSDAHRDAVATTLEAALASSEAAEAVRRGRLVKELDAPSGFGGDGEDGDGLADLLAASTTTEQPGGGDDQTDVASDRGDQADEAEAARRRELEQRVEERAETLTRATEAARDATREAEAARAEVDRLHDELVAAQARAKSADERARVARRAQSEAQQALDVANRELHAD